MNSQLILTPDPPVLVLVGPTAIGKTALSLELSKEFNCEIVSVDSMQVYRYMDIGTAKATAEERAEVRHHLIDIIDPDEQYDAARFFQDACEAITAIRNRNKLPLLTGGTGKIGVRVPDNLIALKLLSLCRFPITSTSANPSGMEEAKTAEEVKNYFSKKIDLIIDGGKCQKALPSTIVEIEKGEIKVLRKGMISEEIIASALTK